MSTDVDSSRPATLCQGRRHKYFRPESFRTSGVSRKLRCFCPERGHRQGQASVSAGSSHPPHSVVACVNYGIHTQIQKPDGQTQGRLYKRVYPSCRLHGKCKKKTTCKIVSDAQEAERKSISRLVSSHFIMPQTFTASTFALIQNAALQIIRRWKKSTGAATYQNRWARFRRFPTPGSFMTVYMIVS